MRTDVPESVSLLALGSFARKELAPCSDVDMLVLLDERDRDRWNPDTFLRKLQEELPQSSYVLRTIGECVDMFDRDLRSWLAVLEGRRITGPSELCLRLQDALRRQIRVKGMETVLMSVRDFARSRHHQYGDSVRLLEPNIKNSAGALRDLHAIASHGIIHRLDSSEVGEFLFDWDELMRFVPIRKERRDDLATSREFLLSVREQMHLAIGHLHDILDYELQKNVAQRLGYGKDDAKEIVELFMREYYRHARHVRSSFQLVFHSQPAANVREDIPLDESFCLRDGVIAGRGNMKLLDGADLMRAFIHVVDSGSVMDAELLRNVDESLHTLENVQSNALAQFDRILRGKEHVGKTIRLMNETGFLGKVLPEFEGLVTFFQHNIYHYYTADEHTTVALEHAEKLAREESHLGKIFRSLRDRSILYYAILLHDMAKPIDLPAHEIAGAELAPEILRRYGRKDISDDVAFLVRNHLKMEQTAFRRNFHDRSTLDTFASLVGTRERLDLLYLLTYADMSAVNPNVWTDWKSVVLRELYELTLRVLEGKDVASLPPVFKTAVRQGKSEPMEVTTGDDFPSQMGLDSELEKHIRAIEQGAACSILVRHSEAHSEVTVIGRDAPYFLSRVSSVFLACDAVTVHARIFTRDDGLVIDTFRLVDIVDKGALKPQQVRTMETLMNDVLTGSVDTEHLFERYRRKWKRKLRTPFNPATRVDVEYHPHRTHDGKEQTIIDVYAPDTYGLLYKLTQTISSFRLTILFAKISTRVDGVVDSFYVTTLEGAPFLDPVEQEELRRALLETITILVPAVVSQNDG